MWLARMAAVAFGVALLPSVLQAGEAPWIEVRSEHFTVVSNAGEGNARRTARQFEEIRAGLEKIWPWASLGGSKPFVVFAVRDEASLRALAPRFWQGRRYRPVSLFSAGNDRNYVALRTDAAFPADDAEANPYFDAYRGYAHVLLRATFPADAPAWFTRGLAEMVGNTAVREKEIRFGVPVSWHLRELRDSARIPIGTLIAVGRGSRYLSGETEATRFDAESWAFVHYLTFGEQGAHAAKFGRFAQLVATGRRADEAFKEALGEPASFDGLLSRYVSGRLFGYSRMEIPPAAAGSAYTVRPLPRAVADGRRSGVLLAMGCPDEARALAEAAAAADPQQGEAHEVLGMLLDRERQREAAQVEYTKAVETGSAGFYAHYRLAQLLRSGGRDAATRARQVELLRKVVELNPEYANGWSYLAETSCERGPCPQAVEYAQKAVTLEPAESYHRLALANVLLASGRSAEALEAARAGVRLADSDAERSHAQQVLDAVSRGR